MTASVPAGNDELRNRAFIDGFHFHGRLVGLDLGDNIARLDLVAFLDQPLGQIASFHGWRECGMVMLIGISLASPYL